MAERRMIKKSILNRDDFTQMPNDAKLLYVILVVNADDEGFVDNPNGLALVNHIAPDCLKLLILKRFVIPFYGGNLIVVRDWRAQNRISERKRQETDYQAELQMLKEVKGRYYLIGAEEIPDQLPLAENAPDENFTGELLGGEEKISGPVQYSTVQVSTVQCSSVQGSGSRATTTTTKRNSDETEIPTLEEVASYCQQRRNEGYENYIDPERFISVNEMRGWMYKGEPIRWKLLIKRWERESIRDKEAFLKREQQRAEIDEMNAYLSLVNQFNDD